MTARRRTVIALIAAGLLAALGYSQVWVLSGRVATVEQGRLYRSAGLPAERLLDLCRTHRITTVVDFRETGAGTASERQVLARAGITYVALPSEQVPSAETVRAFLTVMDERRTEPVLIHCVHGVGRTGVFSAIYRMEYQGWSHGAAIFEAMLISGFGSFGPGSPKAAFLSAYVPRDPKTR